MLKWYGQQREDELLWYLLSPGTGERFGGVFVDVGAHDGVQFSNTLLFEQSGWKGICIEPNPVTFMTNLIFNRKCSCVCAAVGGYDAKEIDFYITDEGMLSSLLPNYRDEYQGRYGKQAFVGWHKVRTPLRRLDTILEQHNYDTIDFVSIDTEAYEAEVMTGFDPNRWKTHLIVLEITLEENVPLLIKGLKSRGYEKIGKLSSNYFFSNREEDKKKIDLWRPQEP